MEKNERAEIKAIATQIYTQAVSQVIAKENSEVDYEALSLESIQAPKALIKELGYGSNFC